MRYIIIAFCWIIIPTSSPSAQSHASDEKELHWNGSGLEFGGKNTGIQNHEKAIVTMNTISENDRSLADRITRYEMIVRSCIVDDTVRCPYTMVMLAELYYRSSDKAYDSAYKRYKLKKRAGEDHSSVMPPIKPVRDCSRSITLYNYYLSRYPKHECRSWVLYRLHELYSNLHYDSLAGYYRTLLVEKIPTTIHHSKPLRLDMPTAYTVLSELEQLRETDFSVQQRQILEYYRGELLLLIGDMTAAKTIFMAYAEKCKKGVFTDCILCQNVERYLFAVK